MYVTFIKLSDLHLLISTVRATLSALFPSCPEAIAALPPGVVLGLGLGLGLGPGTSL